MLLTIRNLVRNPFSSIRHISGKPQLTSTQAVQLRGIHIRANTEDAPNMIFIPEMFDQAENWLQFFTNPQHKILEERNVYIVYPRNFGNSDRCNDISYQEMADDVARFMYEHKISMATIAGHGIGGKVALATACYHYEKVTGIIGLDSSPMNQHYFESNQQIRGYLEHLKDFRLHRSFGAISNELKRLVKCPKWRRMFENNLAKNNQGGYQWNFNLESIWQNIRKDTPSSMMNWNSTIGLYPGRAMFAFPDYSRYVHLGTNTLPMMKSCPQLHGWNQGISVVQGDENPQNHWIYEAEEEIQAAYAFRIRQFLKSYDGVHVLLRNRQEVGGVTLPDIVNARNPRDNFPSEYQPVHYYHNWRFNNVYSK